MSRSTTRKKAARLADNIRRYWAKRGHDVSVEVVKERYAPGHTARSYTVRSNLIDGLPLEVKRSKGTPA